MCSTQQPTVTILIRTVLPDMTTTLDRGPVKTLFSVFSHSVVCHSDNLPNHDKEATICRWEPKAQCRWKVVAHEDRRNWMQAWAPWRRQGRLSRTLAR